MANEPWCDVDFVFAANPPGMLGKAEIRIPALVQYAADLQDVGRAVENALGARFTLIDTEFKEN